MRWTIGTVHLRRSCSAAALGAFVILFASHSLCHADAPDFESQVAPLLVNHCLECHQSSKRSGELNLASRDTMLAGGESGAAINLEQPAESLLLERLRAG